MAWPRRREPPERPSGAVLEVLADATGFHDRPWAGDSTGEMIAQDAAPPPPAPEPLEFEPPPWHDQVASAPLPEPSPPPMDALAAIKAENDDWPELELPGPPVRLVPLEPITLPEPDWEQEARERHALECAEAQRVSREQRAELLREILEENQTAYPAKRKRQP